LATKPSPPLNVAWKIEAIIDDWIISPNNLEFITQKLRESKN
jgi:hypothetical protein